VEAKCVARFKQKTDGVFVVKLKPVTILFALANEDYSILLADRRITINGKSVEDEYNKICVLFCDDARVAIGFTGLATYDGFNTSDWLVDTLIKISNKTGAIAEILFELATYARDKLESLNIKDRRLTFLITGFVYWEDIPRPVAYVLSNYANSLALTAEFNLRSIASTEGTIIEVAGVINQLPPKIEISLKKLLAKELSPASALRFAVNQLKINSNSSSLIGTQANSAIIPAPRNTTVTTTYHSAFHSYRAYGSNVVLTKGMASYGTEIFSSTVIAGEEIRKQDPCWCGSGQRFKDCHLKKFGSFYIRHPAFKRPMYSVSWMDFDEPRPSGRTFCVASGYE
jgi:SEC-C motif